MVTGAAPDVKLADVKWRVQGRPTNGRVAYVPYVDATTVARLLDEWVTPFGWRDDYDTAHGKGMWCHLSVKSGDEWVTKNDVGVPSNMEAEKGLVSDAFKRVASIKWGVARNVYDLPTLWAPCDERANRNGEKVAYPNAQTIPAIIAELKKRGFSDAAAADATTDHDDEPESKSEPEDLESAPANASPEPASFAQHDWLRKEMAGLSAPDKRRVQDWWKDQNLPSIKTKDNLSLEQFDAALLFLNALAEEREKRLARAEQVAGENGTSVVAAQEIASNDADALVARAEAIRAKKVAPKGGADAAAGSAA